MKNKFLLIFCLFIFTFSNFAQKEEDDRRANTPIEPFRIIGNIYYVGAAEVTSFLIATPEGHILIDAGYEETAPQIKANIARLGFKIEDVKFLLNTQAHFDHAGGLAALKRAIPGARLLASREDARLIENGGKGDFRFGDTLPYEAVKIDQTITNGEKVKLGGVSLKAVLTPGHTKGSTSWTLEIKEKGQKYRVIFLSSTTAPGYQFIGNEKYPNIVADYEKTFRTLKKLKVDVFLASHGSFFGLLEKREELQKAKSPNPFIDAEGYRKYLENTEKAFREKLAAEKQAGGK